MSQAIVVLLVLLLAARNASAGSKGLIAFERGDSIWMAKADASGVKKIAKGSGPDLSPDGNRVAFNTDTSTKKEVIRQIAVADLASKKVTVFKNGIPSANCQGAIWSPDGTHILFEIFNEADWHLALINADGSGFRYLRKATPKGNSLWSACWAPDGHSIYAQNLNTIFQIDLDGVELRKWPIATVFPNGGLSSGTKFSLSRDGQTLLVDVEMQDEEANMPDWNGPPPAIWTFDLRSGETKRLTPKGANARGPCWSGPDELFFCTQKRSEKNPSIYKMSLKNNTSVRVLQNAANPVSQLQVR